MKRELTFSVICEENEVFARTALDGNVGKEIQVAPLAKVWVSDVEVSEDGLSANITIAWEGDNDGSDGAPA